MVVTAAVSEEEEEATLPPPVLAVEDRRWGCPSEEEEDDVERVAVLALRASRRLMLISRKSSGLSYSSGGAPVGVVVSLSAGSHSPSSLLRVKTARFTAQNSRPASSIAPPACGPEVTREVRGETCDCCAGGGRCGGGVGDVGGNMVERLSG